MSRFTMCIISVSLWVILYGAGIVVGTQPFRDAFNTNLEWYNVPVFGGIIICCYALTNIAILCCLAAIAGGSCQSEHDLHAKELVAKGLFVYLMLVSGALAIGNSPFEQVTQSSYVRLATMASLISFTVGYFPDVFKNILNKAADRVNTKEP